MPKLGRRSERAELDYRMAPDIIRKDAPFGTTDTPNITMKIIGGRQIPVIEKHPVGVDSYGSRIQPLLPITEKPNHLDPRTYGDNPAGYYNNVQDFFGEGDGSFYDPTAVVNKRPDSKDIARAHYKALPPIQANRTKNDMSTVFEAETWTGNRNPSLAKETEYKTNYFSDSKSNEMEQERYPSQRRNHLHVDQEEYQQLLKIMPSNVFLPNDPINYSRLEPILCRVIAGEMEGGNPQELKDVYLEASQHDKDLRGFCSLEVLDNSLFRHRFRIPDLRLVAAQYVDPAQPGKVNYEKTLLYLDKALKFRDGGDIKPSSRNSSPKRQLDEMAEAESPRTSDRPKYYMSNGESHKLGYYYKEGEVAKLLRTVENELSKSSYFMDWTKWNNAFNKSDRDHRETLSASQIKDICYDNKLPLSDSIINQILALCEDNNRDGQYRWNDFLDFLSRVRPSNTGLPIPVSKRPLDYAKRIPEPVPNWPRTDANTSPERRSPRKDTPPREPSPAKGGYTDRTATPQKPEVQIKESSPDRQIQSPVKQTRIIERPIARTIERPVERQEYQKPADRHRYSPDRRHYSQESPDRQYEQRYPSPVPVDPSVSYRQIDDRSRHYRTYGHNRSINYQRENQSPDRYLSYNRSDNHPSYRDGEELFHRREVHDRPRDEQSGYIPSWYQDSLQRKSPSPLPPRHTYDRDRNYRDDTRYLNRDSYDSYMHTWAQKQMRGWQDSRYNRPKSYAEPQRRQQADIKDRVRPLSYKENQRYDQLYQQHGRQRTPVRRNRSLSPIRHVSPEIGIQYPETYRDSYRVPNPDLYREAYAQNYSSPNRDNQQYPAIQQAPPSPTRFDGPPGGYTGRDYGYSHRDGYGSQRDGFDDYQRKGQYRYDGPQRFDREDQIKQLSHELKDLESKYHMTQAAMKCHDKPWLDRYLKLVEALYNSDVSNKGCLPRKDALDLVKQYNDAFSLGLDMNYASLVAISSGNVDKSGNVLLKPFLTNLSGTVKQSVANLTQSRY